MRIIMVCAGTGGHINPAIAIANMIKEKEADSEILFIGTETGIENDLVIKAGYPVKHVRTGKLIRKLTLENVKAMREAYHGIADAKKIIEEFLPDVIIGTGGYICMPTMIAARKCHVPYILHESNSYPGLSVRLLGKKAKYVLCGFEQTALKFKNGVYTGTPCKFSKEQMALLDKDKCQQELGILEQNKKVVFVTFGSQGAKFLNYKIIDMIASYKDSNILYILVTGTNNYEQVLEYISQIEQELDISLISYIRVEKFVYDMDKMYKAADICITRGGALTCAELVIANKPSIIIPLPYATENHQYYNGKILESVGSAIVIEEKDFMSKQIREEIATILETSEKMQEMEKNLDKLYKPDTMESIYSKIRS